MKSLAAVAMFFCLAGLAWSDPSGAAAPSTQPSYTIFNLTYVPIDPGPKVTVRKLVMVPMFWSTGFDDKNPHPIDPAREERVARELNSRSGANRVWPHSDPGQRWDGTEDVMLDMESLQYTEGWLPIATKYASYFHDKLGINRDGRQLLAWAPYTQMDIRWGQTCREWQTEPSIQPAVEAMNRGAVALRPLTDQLTGVTFEAYLRGPKDLEADLDYISAMCAFLHKSYPDTKVYPCLWAGLHDADFHTAAVYRRLISRVVPISDGFVLWGQRGDDTAAFGEQLRIFFEAK